MPPLTGIVPGRGEAVQVAYGNKDHAAGVVYFWHGVIITWPKYKRPRTLPKAGAAERENAEQTPGPLRTQSKANTPHVHACLFNTRACHFVKSSTRRGQVLPTAKLSGELLAALSAFND